MVQAVLGAAWVAVMVFSSSLAVCAQDCQCKGSDPEIFSGGDGAPLRWLYETTMLMRASSSAPATRCYHRSVQNNSASPVRDIRWEIANFVRRTIFPNHISATCLPIQGDVKAQPSVGPLYFDVSSQGYETTTRQPERGWTEALVAPGDWPGADFKSKIRPTQSISALEI